MLGFRFLAAMGGALACVLAGIAVAGAKNGTSAEIKALEEKNERDAAVFFVATGGPNACGPGCGEWIAFEGSFNKGVSQRFREFLNGLDEKQRPLFFNSPGGKVHEARLIGIMLRERRMTAGVARTVPAGCGSFDQRCRKEIGQRPKATARLSTSGARCSSACVEAFLGATFRQVSADARLRIHSPIYTPEAPLTDANRESDTLRQKRYVMSMGIDPDFVDAVRKVPYERIREMTRNEIARFGIETQGIFETKWMLDRDSRQKIFVRKSITQTETPKGKDYRTSRIAFQCLDPDPKTGLWLIYQREESQPDAKTGSGGAAVFAFGAQELELKPVPVAAAAPGLRRRFGVLKFSALDEALKQPAIEIRDAPADGQPIVIKLSTNGLPRLLDELRTACVPAAAVSVEVKAPAAASALSGNQEQERHKTGDGSRFQP